MPYSLLIPCDPGRVATFLEGPPGIPYGLNALLKEDFQINCSIDANRVTYFVLVPCRAISQTPVLVWQLGTREALPLKIKELLDSNLQPTFLTCLSQLLQLVGLITQFVLPNFC